MKECIVCGNEIESGFFCTLGCKTIFFKENYLDCYYTRRIQEEHDRERMEKQEIQKWRVKIWYMDNPDKSYTDYLQSLGQFKNESNTTD